MSCTYKITFKDNGETQIFENVLRCEETDTEYVLVFVNGKKMPFYKDGIEKPVMITFRPFSTPDNENDA